MFVDFLKKKGVSEENFKKLPIEEMSAMYVEYNDLQFSNLQSAKASKEELAEMQRKFQEERQAQEDAINEKLKAFGLTLKRVTDANANPKATTQEAYVKSITDAHAKLKEIHNAGEKKAFSIDVSLKAVGNMSIGANVTGEIPQAYRIPGMNRIQDRSPFVRDYIASFTVANTNLISWVEQANREGSAGGTAEGAAKNQIDFDLVEASEGIKKRTALITVTEEMLNDIDFMRSEIERELRILLELDVDNQMLQGDGTGQNLNGIITQATVFAAGSFAGTVNDANNYDVLVVGLNQIEQEDFNANVIFVNSIDSTQMNVDKGTDGHYLTYPLLGDGGRSLAGVPIVKNNGVPAGSFVIMDGQRVAIYDREQITLRMGYTGDDFKNNRMTIIIEWRGALVIKGNDVPAIVTGVFSTAKAALETP